nr:MAG TPA: hypothetical protein [Bacteriophage sp.]
MIVTFAILINSPLLYISVLIVCTKKDRVFLLCLLYWTLFDFWV